MKHFGIVLVSVFVLAFSAQVFGASDKNITLKPIDVTGKKLPVVGVAKIDSAVSADTIIGRERKTETAYSFDADLEMSTSSKQKSKNLSGSQVFNDQVVQEYKNVIRQELASSGYQISEAGASNLFEEAEVQDNSRYQIGAIIKKCNTRTIEDFMGSEVTEFHMAEIEWQVFDRKSKKVFYTATSSGWDKKKGVGVQVPAVAAFRKAFRNFLADEKLVAAMEANSTTGN